MLQGCTSRIFQQFEMSCVQNPVVGFEQELDEISQAKKKKTIIVVVGGPAGMEFARVANLRGHQVKLYEKESHLGGQINLITNVKSREEFGEVKRYREVMLKKQGVDITLEKEIDEAFVLADIRMPSSLRRDPGHAPSLLKGPTEKMSLTAWMF